MKLTFISSLLFASTAFAGHQVEIVRCESVDAELGETVAVFVDFSDFRSFQKKPTASKNFTGMVVQHAGTGPDIAGRKPHARTTLDTKRVVLEMGENKEPTKIIADYEGKDKFRGEEFVSLDRTLEFDVQTTKATLTEKKLAQHQSIEMKCALVKYSD